VAVCLCCLSSIGWAQKHPRELPEPREISFTPAKPTVFTLTNGIPVFFFEDRELPVVTINGRLRGGSLYEPDDKTGLASLTGEVMRTGGTPTLPGDQMDEELEFLAAHVGASMSQEYASVTASCLKKDFKRILDIYADVVINPAFPQVKIDLARNQRKENIRRRWDQPAAVSSLLFIEQIYGGTPYGTRTTFKTLNTITREDLIAFHQRFFAPANFYVCVVGDLSLAEAKSMLEEAFKAWLPRAISIPDLPALVEKADGTVFYAYRDTPQANIVMGHLGFRRNHPDERKIEVMNEIFGTGGFTARLMKEIRSNRGLTYGISGSVNGGKDRGVFRIGSQLKAERCAETLSLVKDMIQELQTTPVSDEELDIAKRSLINSFVFRFESLEQVATQFRDLRLNGYPDDYLDKYIENLRKVTKADVQEVAKKYMNTRQMITLVVGDEKKFDRPLSSLGNVRTIDYRKISEAEKIE
jgi:predicted Zn-dependent peptidase